jgi:predicted RNA-binding protein YlxR (DUF448 family)
VVKAQKLPKKHIPKRTCVGCRAVLSKRELIRIVRTSEGILVDPTGKLNGRGAYIHTTKECWERALKGSLAKALRTDISEQDKAYLLGYIANLPENTSKMQN